MAERLRSVKITVEIDTNKTTYRKTVEQGEDESFKDLVEQIRTYFDSVMEYL